MGKNSNTWDYGLNSFVVLVSYLSNGNNKRGYTMNTLDKEFKKTIPSLYDGHPMARYTTIYQRARILNSAKHSNSTDRQDIINLINQAIMEIVNAQPRQTS